ncbi:MAG: BamA/TamA family outer membrane protein [Candidatus Omnitrophota bacterium]
MRHKRVLPLNLQASLNFKCQWASEKLASQEEFYLGGIDSVRGYTSGEYLADNAIQTNFELLIPSFWIPEKLKLPYADNTLRESVTGLVFVDQGYGQKRGPSATERPNATLASVGTGLRIRLFNQALLRLEWGFPLGDKPRTEVSTSRFHFSVDFEDRFPEEMERISKLLHEESIKKLARKLIDDEMARPGSPLRKKMYTYLYLARLAYEKGDLKTAKIYYGKIKSASRALHAQSEEYVKNCMQQQKDLKKDNELAMKYYKDGAIEKAKNLWMKVEKESKIKPLVFEL